jgi:nucleotide-binding universal stress UspA family protein
MSPTQTTSQIAGQASAVGTDKVHFGHIVVGIDFSAHAARALTIAISLAEMFGANLTMVHAVSPTGFDVNGRQASNEVVAAGKDADEDELKQLVERTPGLKALKPQTVVEYGEPAHLINRIAREENANLIALGSHGASGLERLALGSVAEATLRRASCPVLVIGPESQVEQHLFRTILFATDLKTTGATGARYAASLAEQFHGELTVLHVQNEKFLSSGLLYNFLQDRVRRRLKQLLPENIDQLCKNKVRYELGDPSAVITDVVQAESTSLLIVGARNHTLSDHAPWSALSHIIHDAKCPVLGIRDSSI